MKGRIPPIGANQIRASFAHLLLLISVLSVPLTAGAQEFPSALPTFPPIAAPTMLGGSGPQFAESNYQLIAPLLRKCANDWPSTKYVEYRPEIPGKVSIAQSSLNILPFLEALSEQTGRRFAVQRGIDRAVPVSANGEDWLPVLERYVDTAGLDLDNVQDILVITDPKTAVRREGLRGRDILIALAILGSIGLGLAWHFLRPKKRIDPRGGWL